MEYKKITCRKCDRTGKYDRNATVCKYCGNEIGNQYITLTGKVFLNGKYFGRLSFIDTLMHIFKNNYAIYIIFLILLSFIVSLMVSVLIIF